MCIKELVISLTIVHGKQSLIVINIPDTDPDSQVASHAKFCLMPLVHLLAHDQYTCK
jgi:hypothetical protein